MSAKLAITGHTNVGKTTLIRTLLRKPVGEVDDRQNVTRSAESQKFAEFYAHLIDTPGLQNAGAYLAYLRTLEAHGQEVAETIRRTVRLEWEEAAATAIAGCDVCIYVVSLEHVPTENLLDELTLMSSLCGSVVVVLNKSREFARTDSREEADRRKELWKSACEERSVRTVIDFDAHWASPDRARWFLERISELLPAGTQPQFRRGLREFNDKQETMRNRAIEYALECIVQCRRTDISEELKKAAPGEGDGAYIERIKKRIGKVCKEEMRCFLEKSTKLYSLAADVPTLEVEGLGDFDASTATGKSDLMVAATTAATILTALTSVAGLAAGPLITGLTAPAAATAAGAIGGGLGLIVGFAGAASRKDKLKAIQAGHVAMVCLGTLWILSCCGWGKGDRIPDYIFRAIDERSKEVMRGIDSINWHTASSHDMKEWIIRFLDRVAELH